MNYFQILNPHRVKEYLKVNEPLLRALVKEPPRTSNIGRKRIAEGEVGNSSFGGDCKDRGDNLEKVGRETSMV